MLPGAAQQRLQVLRRRGGGPPLKLHGLAGARQRADSDAARAMSPEIADQEIAAMKLLHIFVNNQADKQIAPRLALLSVESPAKVSASTW